MLGYSPNGTRPISSLRSDSLGSVIIVAQALIEARFSNPLADLMQDPRKRLVFAVDITSVPVGE